MADNKQQNGGGVHHLSGMYQNWFLDYASYVILERAVPHIGDGFKPVQRRILHSMKRMDDGRYNKVANIVGHTMQFHPHGDASIKDALVQLGQKELLIDCQGNWGNILTGDDAAAARYIEARLSKFALDVVFNPKTTEWKLSYDGRNKEPVALPVKFPLLLAQGAEGIAVGLSCKILPHNVGEICEAAIKYLRGEEFHLYPDFPTGGSIDVSRYNDGQRGGAVRVRAKIEKRDNKTLAITEIPFGKTTGTASKPSTFIDSILKAAEKGKIKVRKVEDMTSANVEILVHLTPGASSDKTIDALYACTDCEVSISPNCCVIDERKPQFLAVSDVLRRSVDNTLELLRQERLIRKGELLEQLHFASLEQIFIEERIYKDKKFENAKTMDEACEWIDERLTPWYPKMVREVTKDDILRLMEIKMARILKFNKDKAEELMARIREELAQIDKELANMVEVTCQWFQFILEKYGKDHPRLTEIKNFDTISAATVVEANEKLYINREEGFIGTSLKKDEYICNCSDIDDVIIFYKDGTYKVVKVADKIFVGETERSKKEKRKVEIIHVAIFKKSDTRIIYNAVY
ncbi:MAG: DNA gyrase/topoisomerase IV subunit A, partial [Bacteroidaceae bacterium]|nr:DNA gyrase/topoisomerase IV subunit A [Bacteroidaceae bacterium]